MVNEFIFCFVETVLVDLLEMEGGHEIHENMPNVLIKMYIK